GTAVAIERERDQPRNARCPDRSLDVVGDGPRLVDPPDVRQLVEHAGLPEELRQAIFGRQAGPHLHGSLRLPAESPSGTFEECAPTSLERVIATVRLEPPS